MGSLYDEGAIPQNKSYACAKNSVTECAGHFTRKYR